MAANPASSPLSGRSALDGQRVALAQFERHLDEKPALQWWHGVVVQKAVPNRAHGLLQTELAALLRAYAMATGGAAWTEAHVWFEGEGYLVPDVAYWDPGKPQGDDRRSLPPTLAIEIRSPDEPMQSQREKCRRMRHHGVDACWLIDPVARVAERFDAAADGEPLPAGGTLSSAALPGFELSLAALWAVLPA
ncbi:MAG: Uma2 family endonuclease [Dehalococcoidia bacterium]